MVLFKLIGWIWDAVIWLLQPVLDTLGIYAVFATATILGLVVMLLVLRYAARRLRVAAIPARTDRTTQQR